jgi:predicted TPR repeat methyltransferase
MSLLNGLIYLEALNINDNLIEQAKEQDKETYNTLIENLNVMFETLYQNNNDCSLISITNVINYKKHIQQYKEKLQNTANSHYYFSFFFTIIAIILAFKSFGYHFINF